MKLDALNRRLSNLENTRPSQFRLIWYDDPSYGKDGHVRLKWLDELPKKI